MYIKIFNIKDFLIVKFLFFLLLMNYNDIKMHNICLAPSPLYTMHALLGMLTCRVVVEMK